MNLDDYLPVAILIPSLNRPQRIRPTLEAIKATTPTPYRVIWCVSDPESILTLQELGETFITDSDETDRRYVTRMNKLIGEIGDAKTVFFGSDDVLHRPGWFDEAVMVMDTGPSVVVVNDLRNRNGTQALVRASYLPRAVFDDPTVAFHPGYLHNFADNEMFFTAHQQGEYARAMLSVVEHFHPLFKTGNDLPWDDTYKVASQGWDHDELLWRERAKLISQVKP